jgi:manganese/zinc/iron transport system permease protein
MLVAPRKGVLPKLIRRKKYQNKMLRENLLKELYHLEEKNPDRKSFTVHELLDEREMKSWNYTHGLRMLRRRNLVNKLAGNYILTEKGHEAGKRITRIHRLWEMYLTQHLNIASDHVHEDAEAIEHIITPEVERRLIELLAYPEKDPHEKEIPY